MPEESPKPVVTLGIPTGEYFTVCSDFHKCLTQLICYSYENNVVEKINLIYAQSPNTAANRNTILNLHEGAYMVQIDADMTFPPNALEQLIDTAEKFPNAVITGFGCVGNSPNFPAIYKWDGDKMEAHPTADWPDEPFDVGVCGSFGFLVPDNIVKVLGNQAFNHIIVENNETKKTKEIEHDFAFCIRAQENGFRIVCNPDIEFGHIRPYPIGKSDWLAQKEIVLASEKEAKKGDSKVTVKE